MKKMLIVLSNAVKVESVPLNSNYFCVIALVPYGPDRRGCRASEDSAIAPSAGNRGLPHGHLGYFQVTPPPATLQGHTHGPRVSSPAHCRYQPPRDNCAVLNQVPQALLNGLQQGVSDAIKDLTSPSNYDYTLPTWADELLQAAKQIDYNFFASEIATNPIDAIGTPIAADIGIIPLALLGAIIPIPF